MNTVAPDHRSSSYMRGMSTPKPYGAGSAPPPPLRKLPSTAPAPTTTSLLHRSGGEPAPHFNSLSSGSSPMNSLVSDLNSSLHLDTSTSSSHSLSHSLSLLQTPSKASKAPGFEPFVCRSAQSPFSTAKEQTTPLLSRSRKRQIEEQGSPALAMYMNSPTAASWARKQQPGRSARGGSMLTSNSAGAPSLGLFRRESLNTDD
ncbi:hypothetical protein H4S07_004474, partial [Coemansia furcata]